LAEGEQQQSQAASAEELIAQLRAIQIEQFLLSNVSMLASLTYEKLDGGELGQAHLGIDALAALLPVLEGQIPAEAKRDLDAALTNLQVAYADRAARDTVRAEDDNRKDEEA
jgi:hypothetical protein